MKRLRLIALCLLLLFIAGWTWDWCHREPTYHGKTLQEWILACDDKPNDPTIRAGLDRIVVKAVPYYTKQLHKKNTKLDDFLQSWWPRLPGLLRNMLAEPLPEENRRINATLVLKYAGPVVRSATPALITSQHDSSPAVRQAVIEALIDIERQSELILPLYMAACQDPFYGVRRYALEALGRYGPAAKVATPVIMERLADQHPLVRACAAGALWAVARQTNEVLRILAETMHDPDPGARTLSAFYSGDLGPTALPLVPALIQDLTDNKEVAEQAREALKKIDPKAAAKAGVR